MKLLMCVTDGFEDIEAIGTLAILRRAKLDVTFCAIDAREAKGRYGVDVVSLDNLHDLNTDEYDMLILPGGPEYLAEERNPSFLRMIENFADHNKYIAAICAAPTILGHLGLLKNHKYTCFTSMNEDFGGTYCDDYAVRDKNFITGKSAAAVLPFAFLIVETLMGKDYAQKVKDSIYYKD